MRNTRTEVHHIGLKKKSTQKKRLLLPAVTNDNLNHSLLKLMLLLTPYIQSLPSNKHVKISLPC